MTWHNMLGAGVAFGPDRVQTFLDVNNLKMIVRSHECVSTGAYISKKHNYLRCWCLIIIYFVFCFIFFLGGHIALICWHIYLLSYLSNNSDLISILFTMLHSLRFCLSHSTSIYLILHTVLVLFYVKINCQMLIPLISH